MTGDLRYALKIFFRQPLVSIVVVLTMALGIGINVAIFSVADAVLVHPLPYPYPDQLVRITGDDTHFGPTPFSYPDYLDWRSGQHTFTEIAAYALDSFNARIDNQTPQRVAGAITTANFFHLLGTSSSNGRTFLSAEDQQPTAPTPVIISNRFWRKTFARDPRVIGRILSLDETPCQVVGVASPDVEQPSNVDVYLPLGVLANTSDYRDRGNRRFYGIGRLRPGVRPEQADGDLKRIAQTLSKAHPETNANSSVSISRDVDRLVRKYRSTLWLLIGATSLILLISITNVINLRSNQISSKFEAWAIRAALGASFWRLAFLIAVEGSVLAILGGILGIIAAIWTRSAIVRLAPGDISRLNEIHLDGVFVLFSVILLAGATIVVGFAPALQLKRTELGQWLQSSQRTSPNSRVAMTMQAASIVGQIAISFTLCMGAAVLLQTLWQLQKADLGFDPRSVLTAQMSLSSSRYTNDVQIMQFFERLMSEIHQMGEVESVAISNAPPFGPIKIRTFLVPLDQPQSSKSVHTTAAGEYVSDEYFQSLRILLLKGREFGPQDTKDSEPVVIIDEMVAKHDWPGKDALGAHLIAPDDPSRKELTVIGIVGAVLRDELSPEKTLSSIYFAQQQQTTPYSTLLIRTKAGYEPMALVPSLTKLIARIDPNQPIYNVRLMTSAVSASANTQRAAAYLVSVFSTLGLVLIAVGIYGVLAYRTTRRTREMGIRLALGAERGDILRLVLRSGLALTAVGIALGFCCTFAMNRVLSALIPASTGLSLSMLVEGTLLLIVVALFASLLPARRASLVDPAVAIRSSE
jgi:putative ABC transport system permease protein